MRGESGAAAEVGEGRGGREMGPSSELDEEDLRVEWEGVDEVENVSDGV